MRVLYSIVVRAPGTGNASLCSQHGMLEARVAVQRLYCCLQYEPMNKIVAFDLYESSSSDLKQACIVQTVFCV